MFIIFFSLKEISQYNIIVYAREFLTLKFAIISQLEHSYMQVAKHSHTTYMGMEEFYNYTKKISSPLYIIRHFVISVKFQV